MNEQIKIDLGMWGCLCLGVCLCVCVCVCVCVEDLSVQQCFICSDSESVSAEFIADKHKQRLILCSLCLLSHCSKSVYSKSLDIPDARTKCSKEERYSRATHSSPFHPHPTSISKIGKRCSGVFC